MMSPISPHIRIAVSAADEGGRPQTATLPWLTRSSGVEKADSMFHLPNFSNWHPLQWMLRKGPKNRSLECRDHAAIDPPKELA
jgi:hypothetical protein